MKKGITQRIFGTLADGTRVIEFTLTNDHGMEMKVINYGCTITSLRVPDRNGVSEDVVLGFDTLDGYLQSKHYFGCVIGRYANRIAYGKFSIGYQHYTLQTNLSPHHLHGGHKGFGQVKWAAEEIQDEHGVGILFRYYSPDGDEGYPGNVHVEVHYFLDQQNALTFEYRATTDQETIINLTQHSYFNLNGGKENILKHELSIDAYYFLPVDKTMIPTGEMRPVDQSPFDFRHSKPIGVDIDRYDPQILIAHGFDHTWVLNGSGTDVHAASLYEPVSGRKMDVWTTEPGIQVYTANFLEHRIAGKNDTYYGPRYGVCLETQHFPDSPHHAGFPSVKLKPGQSYYSKTRLAFSTY